MSKNILEPWWYRHVPRDFMSSPDVQIMTAEECGSYFFLLQNAWLGGQDCTLPNDPERLAKLARVGKVSELVLGKFSVDKDGRLFNPRLLEEWNDAVKRSKDASKAAKKSHATGLRSQSRRSAAAMPTHSDSPAININTNTHINKTKTMQGHAEADSATDVASDSASPSQPARRVAEKLAETLGRANLKRETVTAWAKQAEGIVAAHGEQMVLHVIHSALVDSSDGFWRGRVYAMKNFVRCFNTMLEQVTRKTAGTRAAADPLAQRAASLQTGHDFSAIAKGEL
jgi:uncharacterized protein YdaU (DUF1376 family)